MLCLEEGKKCGHWDVHWRRLWDVRLRCPKPRQFRWADLAVVNRINMDSVCYNIMFIQVLLVLKIL